MPTCWRVLDKGTKGPKRRMGHKRLVRIFFLSRLCLLCPFRRLVLYCLRCASASDVTTDHTYLTAQGIVCRKALLDALMSM